MKTLAWCPAFIAEWLHIRWDRSWSRWASWIFVPASWSRGNWKVGCALVWDRRWHFAAPISNELAASAPLWIIWRTITSWAGALPRLGGVSSFLMSLSKRIFRVIRCGNLSLISYVGREACAMRALAATSA